MRDILFSFHSIQSDPIRALCDRETRPLIWSNKL